MHDLVKEELLSSRCNLKTPPLWFEHATTIHVLNRMRVKAKQFDQVKIRVGFWFGGGAIIDLLPVEMPMGALQGCPPNRHPLFMSRQGKIQYFKRLMKLPVCTRVSCCRATVLTAGHFELEEYLYNHIDAKGAPLYLLPPNPMGGGIRQLPLATGS